MEEPHLHKVFIGKLGIRGNRAAENPLEQEWETAMFKTERQERIWLWKNGLEGDQQVDLQKVVENDCPVFVYPIKHYTYLKEKFGREDIVMGTMGENFAVLELDEFTVCIGDKYKIGNAVVEVSQPKLPNWQQARRHQLIDLASHLQQIGRTGWHFRVLREGYVERDTAIELIERPHPEWTVQAVNEIVHIQKDDLRSSDELLDCESLGLSIRARLKRRLRGQAVDETPRLYGPNK